MNGTIAGHPIDVWLIHTIFGDRWAASLSHRPRAIGRGHRLPHNVWTGPPTEEGKAYAIALLAHDIEVGPLYA